MGTYLELIAKPGCEDQINAAYAAMTGDSTDWLVYSEKIIIKEIAFIHSPKGAQRGAMRGWLRTVEDWNRGFPTQRCGTGQRKLSGIGEDELERIAQIKRDIQFVLDHRMLFSSIDGLDYARDHGFCDYPLDVIENHEGKRRASSDEPLFADLPRGRCAVYRLCVQHGRPDLWKAYHAFKREPTWDHWSEVRTKNIPWLRGMTTVWQQLETFARQQDGQDYGLRGRFRDGNIPSLFQLRAALRAPAERIA